MYFREKFDELFSKYGCRPFFGYHPDKKDRVGLNICSLLSGQRPVQGAAQGIARGSLAGKRLWHHGGAAKWGAGGGKLNLQVRRTERFTRFHHLLDLRSAEAFALS